MGYFSRKSVADHDVLPVTWSFKCKSKPDWKIRKFKERYRVRGDIQKRLSPKPLNLYSPVVQWATVRLMLIFQCILGLQSQSIDLTDAFAQADIPSGAVYVDDFLFWELSQSEIDNVMNSFKEDGPSYNWEHPKGESVS